MKLKRHWALFIISVLAMFELSPINLMAWKMSGEKLVKDSLETGYQIITNQISSDMDHDGTPENLIINNGKAEIVQSGNTRWQSPEGWEITQGFLADLNRDQETEAVLLVWRKYQPWPIDRYLANPGRINTFHDSQNRSCQVILIGWWNKKFRERWAGSSMVRPISQIWAADVDENGKQELIALESQYDDPPTKMAHAITVWEWNGFGFTLKEKIVGNFSQLILLSNQEKRIKMITDGNGG